MYSTSVNLQKYVKHTIQSQFMYDYFLVWVMNCKREQQQKWRKEKNRKHSFVCVVGWVCVFRLFSLFLFYFLSIPFSLVQISQPVHMMRNIYMLIRIINRNMRTRSFKHGDFKFIEQNNKLHIYIDQLLHTASVRNITLWCNYQRNLTGLTSKHCVVLLIVHMEGQPDLPFRFKIFVCHFVSKSFKISIEKSVYDLEKRAPFLSSPDIKFMLATWWWQTQCFVYSTYFSDANTSFTHNWFAYLKIYFQWG